MLTKTLSEAKKKQRNILIKAMNNDIGSIDSSKDSWNPAQISERAKDISYIRSLVDTWNPAQLNEALKMQDLPIIDTWNPAQIEEQRRNLVLYLAERTLTGNPITLKILGNITPEVDGLKVTMTPIQDLHGQSAPYPAGGGKNKSSVNSVSGVAWAVANADLKNVFNSLQNGTYTISFSIKVKTVTSTGEWAYGFMAQNPNGNISKMNNVTTDATVGDEGSIVQTFAITDSNRGAFTGVNLYGCGAWATGAKGNADVSEIQIELGNQATDFAPYSNICPISGRTEVSVTRTAGEDVETKTHQYSETIYGGVDDFVSGGLTNEWGYIASYDGETLPGEWISDRDVYAPGTTPTAGAEVAYKLATPTTISTSAEEITLLKGENVLSTDGDSIELKYKQNF